MIYVVTRIQQLRIVASSDDEAISKVISGEGELLNTQDIANRQQNFESKPVLEWPFWAKGFRQLAKPQDAGIGDTIARIIGPENSYAFKQWFKRIFNQDCGCAGRQALWNQMYPLK